MVSGSGFRALNQNRDESRAVQFLTLDYGIPNESYFRA